MLLQTTTKNCHYN